MSGAVLLALPRVLGVGVVVVVLVELVEPPSPLPVALPSPELVVDGLAVTGWVLAPVPRSTTTSGVLVLGVLL
jgi:hypothetical protein